MQLWNSASYSSMTTDYNRMALKRWWCTQQEYQKWGKTLCTTYFLSAYLKATTACVALVVLYHRCLRQEPNYVCGLITKAEVNYSPKPVSSKKGKIKLGKNQYSYFLYRENGKEEFYTNAVSTSNPTETDFQMNVLKFQHFWAVAWTTWKGKAFLI